MKSMKHKIFSKCNTGFKKLFSPTISESHSAIILLTLYLFFSKFIVQELNYKCCLKFSSADIKELKMNTPKFLKV